jgi:hypothetical protein
MAKQEKARARSVLLVAALLLITVVGGLVVAGAAGAATNDKGPRDPYFTPSDSVLPSRISTPPPRSHTVPPFPPGDHVLPFTGADVTLFIITGVAAIATGTVLVRRTRARRQTS